MNRSAIIIFLVNYCAFLFSQELRFSREFESLKKNLPIAIINNHPSYFHVLRYNRAIHDFTIERRKKETSEIIAFTAMRLDSVNANWFDYSNLEYIFHENDHHLYFIFEKIVNTKREIFLKVIDTLGKSSGFKLIETLETSANIEGLEFKFRLVNKHQLMVIGIKTYVGGNVKKFVELFDLKSKERVWLKNLPIENATTGYSTSFACNAKGDLYYVILKSQLDYYKRLYQDNRQTQIPVFLFSSIELVCFDYQNSSLYKKELLVTDINVINTISLYPSDSTLSFYMHFAKGETPKTQEVFFWTQQWNSDLSKEIYFQTTPLSAKINSALVYYGGSDYKTAADKEFVSINHLYANGSDAEVSEHTQIHINEELLFVEWNKQTGDILQQQLIPRKASFNDERAKLKNIGRVNWMVTEHNYYFFTLENRANAKLQLEEYKHKSFKTLKTIYNSDLVLYTISKSAVLKKQRIYENDKFDNIPIAYSTTQNEIILFLDGTDKEKFAILKVNPN